VQAVTERLLGYELSVLWRFLICWTGLGVDDWDGVESVIAMGLKSWAENLKSWIYDHL
jgi:hypothetical protein